MTKCALTHGAGAPPSQLNDFFLGLSQLIHKMGSAVHTVKWLPSGFYL